MAMPQVQGRLPIRGTERCGGTAGALFENECSAFFPLMVNFLLFACRLTCSSECVHQTVVFWTCHKIACETIRTSPGELIVSSSFQRLVCVNKSVDWLRG